MFRDRVHKRKPVCTAQQGTLDVHHSTKLHDFDARIHALQAALDSGESGVTAQKQAALEREMADVERERLDYWETTFDILTKYYRMCDDDEPAQHAPPLPTATQHSGKKLSSLPGQRTLLQFCNVGGKGEGMARSEVDAPPTSPVPAVVAPAPVPVVHVETTSRAGLLREYMMAVDPTQVKPIKRDRAEALACQACQVERVVMEADGVAICPKCGSQDVVLVESDCISVGADASKEYSSQSYRRVNHLSETLSQVQGRESTVIPEALVDSIMMELKKERVTDMRNITPKMMRGILKRLGSSKYYEHITTIIRTINGLPPLRISPELEDKIKAMFREVQPAFSRVCPASRSNFLQYNYVISRILLLLGEPELASFFPPLKSREKQAMAESTWKAVCTDLEWPFMPSI